MNLNQAQRAAVEHQYGPLLVLAGAGTGKTRVITNRIARLLSRGSRPEAILAVSFTNKAAAEMGERMVPLVGADRAKRLWLSTFHSLGVRFLSEERKALGVDGPFVVFDESDSLGVIREILRKMRRSDAAGRRLDPSAILARISRWKNELVAPEAVPETDVEYDAVARDVYPEYLATLRAMSAFDFDDLVVAPLRLLCERDDIRAKWRNRFQHLLVDEFQDTNTAQLGLVRELANEMRNVCVVGDDDQAIYGWRGADVGNILEFETHFPGAKIIALEDNYRSSAPILSVANAAISTGVTRKHAKVLRPCRGGGDKVQLLVADTPEHEAQLVAREIRSLRDRAIPFKDVAVLYRSNGQAKALEEELRACGVPYRLFGGTQFFDRKEVKDAAAYLRIAAHPRDEISLRRILNYPARGIGETTVERMDRFAKARGMSFADVFYAIDQVHDLPDAAVRGARSLAALLGQTRKKMEQGMPLTTVARQMLEEAGMREEILDPSEGSVGAKRWANVEYFLSAIERFENQPNEEKPSLSTFLTRITLRFDDEEEDPKNAVTLSTLHGAKGLEFRCVFLVGCVEGQLPHSRTTDPKVSDAAPADLEEERRLFYVGVTRAKEKLYLTRARRRMLRGRVTPLTPSRFLDGLPEDELEIYEHEQAPSLELDDLATMSRALLEQLRGQ